MTGKCLFAELLGLEVWNQGMTLGMHDPKTGAKSWESQFGMPVISAFLPSGAEIPLSQAAAPALALPEAPEGTQSLLCKPTAPFLACMHYRPQANPSHWEVIS